MTGRSDWTACKCASTTSAWSPTRGSRRPRRSPAARARGACRPEDRLIRRIARAGFADHGLELSVDHLWPEPALAADGAWWHPVAIAEPTMQVASTPLPLLTVLAVLRAALNDPERDRSTALAAFRCT